MNDWNTDPPTPRTYRFSVGEIAVFIRPCEYANTPCEVLEVGGFVCGGCGRVHDYNVKLCDGTTFLCDDPDLKKLEPPADALDETTTEELEETI